MESVPNSGNSGEAGITSVILHLSVHVLTPEVGQFYNVICPILSFLLSLQLQNPGHYILLKIKNSKSTCTCHDNFLRFIFLRLKHNVIHLKKFI